MDELARDGWELDCSLDQVLPSGIVIYKIAFIHNGRQFIVEQIGSSIADIVKVMYPALLGMRQEKEEDIA